MQSFKHLIKEELSGWKPFDIIWLVSVCAVITIVTLLTSNTEAFGSSHPTLSSSAVRACVVCSIIASIIGVINVVLGDKDYVHPLGKRSARQSLSTLTRTSKETPHRQSDGESSCE